LGGGSGDQTVNDYYVEVWLLDGSSDFNSLVTNGRSAKVDGSGSWDYSSVSFVFASDVVYDCSGTNQYAIVIKAIDDGDSADTAGEVDGTNYTGMGFNDEGDTMNYCEGLAHWDGSGTLQAVDAEDDPKITVYTKQ
jgi:hypothetical protein